MEHATAQPITHPRDWDLAGAFIFVAQNLNSRRRTHLDGQANGCTKASAHIDQRVGAKEVNTPAEEIADSWLRHT